MDFQVKNALSNVCLAGSHHDIQRSEAFQAIDQILAQGLIMDEINNNKIININQFIILFYHSKSLAFRGIYGIIPNTNPTEFIRIFGRGSKLLKDIQVESYMKYSSSSHNFVTIPTKSITQTTDAISIDPSKLKK